MDRTILTPKQQLHVAGIRFMQGLAITQPDFTMEGTTPEDMIRRIKNDEFAENGIEGVRLVESQVDNRQ